VTILWEEIEKKQIGYYLISLLTWQALAYHGLRQDAQALASLKRALTLAAPGGYVRTFIGKGPVLFTLLHQARAAGIMPEYVQQLLAASERGTKDQPIQALTTSPLVEPLSEREKDVLRLLAKGCTDKKIAESLVIARETVHKHLKNIYGKLDVHSRAEATLRAHELGLL
jgi:LuxR family maltose regulon positive regulatory protein